MIWRNTIRSWALIAVAVSSFFTIGISIWLIYLLSSQDWCTRALGAASYANGRPEFAVGGCYTLLLKQIDYLGPALIICIGVQALSLAVLVVIVLAGGKLSFKANKDGVEGNVSRDAIHEGDSVTLERDE